MSIVLYLQPVGSEGAYKILPARGKACIHSRPCPIFITVCSTSDFSVLQITLTLFGITFYKCTFTFIFLIWSCTSSWQDLKRLRKYNRLGGTACIFKSTLPNFFNDLLQILLCCTPNQSYTPLNHFFQEHVHIYLFLCGLVPLVGGILKGARKYYRLEVQLAYLSDCPIFITVCCTFYLSTLQIVILHSLESFF